MLKRLHLHILLLALLWIPLSQHCSLQAAGLLQLGCEIGLLGQNTQSCQQGDPCSFESTSAKTSPSYRSTIKVNSDNIAHYETVKVGLSEKQLLVSSFDCGSPELLSSWVFLYGLSKPARAPDAVC